MQLKYSKNICQAVDGMQKIQSICWAPNGKRMALVSADRVVQLFNEQVTIQYQCERKDKFATKAQEKGQKSYIIRAIEFSPDSQKIAVAQSDNIVFIYKIGVEWGEKKSICNKFPASSAVTCMTWPRDKPDLVFGLAEGKVYFQFQVKMGVLKSNKSQLLYSTDSYVVAIASSRDGASIVSGHLDCSVYAYYLDRQQYSRIFVHHSIPYALGWGEHVVAAGNDAKVSFYDSNGNFMQRFDYTNDDNVRDFVNASFNQSGDTVILGNFNRFYIYNFNKKREQWEEIGVKKIDNYYTVTALCWKNDGSKFLTGSLCGSVDLYDASLRKVRYKGKFEFNYVSPSQIVIQTLSNGNRMVIKTNIASEITRINVLQDRFVVANTLQSLIIGDLDTNKISEIMWRGSGNEKYDFSNPNVCMVYNAGELTLVEYGNNEPLGNCRTEHVKPHLISTRLCYSEQDAAKSIAYLLDLQTICVLDLNTGNTLVNINHDSKIDFLELNARANKLIFRDKRRQLYLFNLKTLDKNTLLNYCNYAQWVPDSEVVVAQNRQNLSVWYSIDNPDKVTIYNIKGDVELIERTAHKTEVIVNEANNQVAYTLDEPMIEFGFAVENRELENAASILDPLELTPEIEANWRTLAKIALQQQDIVVAEHCYAALGDISKATYLRKTQKLAHEFETENQKDGITSYKVQARLALLEKQFNVAEALYLDHDEVEEAMDFYQELHKWDESIKIAERKNHPDVKELKQNYFQWLLDTNQEGKAAEVKEQEGDYIYSIQLYLKGGLPAKAANVVFTYNMSFPQEILEKIASALSQSGMYEKAGEFYEQMEMLQKALDCYCKGFAFGKAVDLAKRAEPRLVVNLEERWGDWLVSQKQTENAVNHYIEAGSFQKAVEAAISARQWSKAVQLLQGQTPEVSRPFFRQIAKHYSEVRQQDLAEKYYLKAGQPVDAFEMYISSQKWDQALKVAKDNLPSNDIVSLYMKQAQKCEQKGNYKDAEKLYVTVDEPDQAIQMYKKASLYDHMIRLIAKYRKNLLKDTHQAIGQKFQQEGNLKMAEHHFIESGNWHLAVEAYRQSNLWEDAIRVCRQNGNEKETCELAKKWAETLGNDAGMKMLLKLNLVDVIIEYLSDRHDFEEAFKMSKQSAKHKVGDVHLKYALYLEDEQRYKEAEEHFIKAGKPSEAINMYEVQTDFHSALQIARQYEPNSVQAIFINQAKYYMERSDYQKAELAYVSAKKPEYAIKMYTDLNSFSEALRVAKKHAPQLVNEINKKAMSNTTGPISGEDLLNSAKIYEESRDFRKAIDTYLDINQNHFPNNTRNLEYAWERAVQLAMNFDRSRVQEITQIACEKLRRIQKYELAAELYESIGNIEKAVQSYMDGFQWDKARAAVAQLKGDERNSLEKLVEKAYKDWLKKENRAEEMIQSGDIQGLDMFVERGDWQSALTGAKQQSPEVFNRYLMRFAKQTMEAGKFGETVKVFAEYGIFSDFFLIKGIQALPQNYPIYKTLILEIFADCDQQEISLLRTCLGKFMNLLEQKQEINTPAGKEFKKYMMITHLINLSNIYQKRGMIPLYSQISQQLLRFCDLVRVDKLFYNAGVACKKANQLPAAFIILNRYLDLFEVIEDPENNSNLAEQGEFSNTDIPNLFDVPLPEANLISEKDKQNLSDWLLQVSIDPKVSKCFPLRNCEACHTKIWENAVRCPSCKTQSETCIISGKPILKGQATQCQHCSQFGNKDAWTEYYQNFANCPWCNQSPN